MGTTYTMHCSCGYQKELHLGNGLGSFNVRMAKRLFGEEVYAAYEKNHKANTSFILTNELCFCSNCKALSAQATFTYTNSEGKEIKIVNPCTGCGQIPQLLPKSSTDSICCPKCGQVLFVDETGLWD